MGRYAVVRGGVVENVVVWDVRSRWTPPSGTVLVEDGDRKAAIGGTYAGGVFGAPPARPSDPVDDTDAKLADLDARLRSLEQR